MLVKTQINKSARAVMGTPGRSDGPDFKILLCKWSKDEHARFDSGHRFTAKPSPGVKTESSTCRLGKN